jgi:hypothetical protein
MYASGGMRLKGKEEGKGGWVEKDDGQIEKRVGSLPQTGSSEDAMV